MERVRYRQSETKITNKFGEVRTITLIEFQPPCLDPDGADREFFEKLKGTPTIVDTSGLTAVPAAWVRLLSEMTIDNLDLVFVMSEGFERMAECLGQKQFMRAYKTVEAAAEWWWDD